MEEVRTTEHDHDLLVRIDERTSNLCRSLDGVMKTMVTQKEFAPVKTITYSLVGIIMTGILLALLGSILPD